MVLTCCCHLHGTCRAVIHLQWHLEASARSVPLCWANSILAFNIFYLKLGFLYLSNGGCSVWTRTRIELNDNFLCYFAFRKEAGGELPNANQFCCMLKQRLGSCN